MNLTLNSVSHSATQEIATYISEQYQLKFEHHIRFIAQSVFAYMSEKNPQVKNWNFCKLNSEQQSFVRLAVEHILISPKTPWAPHFATQKLTHLQQLALSTIRGNLPPLTKLLKKDYILAVVWKRNPQILKEARELMSQLLIDIAQELKQKEHSSSESFHFEMIIGDLLSLYPFLSPEQNETLRVPVLVDGKWQLIEYKVDRLSLTPAWVGSPLVAFGLVPQTASAPPLLLFKGTTYPTDDGFLLSLIVDINPFASVGDYGFKLGEKIISNWLNKHAAASKAIIYGKSLGGALARQAALSFTAQVDRVMAFGAPGLFSSELKRYMQLEKEKKLPAIHLFCQENDPVPAIDQMVNSGIHYYKVLGKHARRGVFAHADMYSTHEVSAILHLDPKKKESRWLHISMTITRMLASIFVFPVLIFFSGMTIVMTQTLHLLNRQVTILHSSLSVALQRIRQLGAIHLQRSSFSEGPKENV